MKRIGIFAAVAAMLCFAESASAQLYVTGDFTTPAFSPGTGTAGGGTAADLAGFDDGSHGDAVAGDGIFTTTITGLTPSTVIAWKWASTGFAQEVPACSGPNFRATVPAGGTLVFFRDTNTQGDGFVPDAGTNPTALGVGYDSSLATFAAGATSIKAVGSFQTNGFSIGDPDAVTLTDTFGGDPAGDGIYTGPSVTGLTPGSKQFKVVFNEAFDNPADMTPGGFVNSGCGNMNFNVLDPSDVITFTFNANTGRVRAFNASAVPGPPFFAQSSAWSTGYSSAENLGAPVDGVYRKAFNVAIPGNYTVRVRQGLGRSFPDTGDYPFTTTTPNQAVLVVFDRNIYADNYFPQSDFVAVVDGPTKDPLNTFDVVQPVGAWQSEFGASDYSTGVAAMQAQDDGVTATSGDVTAGDGVFAVRLTELDNVGGTNQNMKAVAQRVGLGDTGFKIQLGGPQDGLTIDGNNSQSQITYAALETITFQIDTTTGRVGLGTTVPLRPAILDPATAAEASAWDMYN